MAGDQYACGNWDVQAGSEDEFIARWQAFITESAKPAPGFGSARLLRDAVDPRHFLSFSDWADAASRDAWKASPEFERGLTSCRELCDEFAGADSAQVARFWTGGDPPPPRAVIPSLVVFASIGSHRRAACGCGLPRTGRPKFRPLDPQAHLGACRRYGDGTNGWRPRGVPHRRSHILDLAGREGGAATPSAAPPPFPASAPR